MEWEKDPTGHPELKKYDWNENIILKISFTKISDSDESVMEHFTIFDTSPIDCELSSENLFFQNIGIFQYLKH